MQFYESGALANAEVAIDNLLSKNRQLMQFGHVISPEEYRLEAEKQPALPVRQGAEKPAAEEEDKPDPRGQRIVARMDCPCGFRKKGRELLMRHVKKYQEGLDQRRLQRQGG